MTCRPEIQVIAHQGRSRRDPFSKRRLMKHLRLIAAGADHRQHPLQ